MSSITNLKTYLHNGIEMDTLGYRVDKNHNHKTINNVESALQAGLRRFDITCDIETEELVSKALDQSDVARNELFLTLKLANQNHGYDATLRAFERTIKRMKTDYLDMYLVNWPNPIQYRDQYEKIAIETWQAMESLYKSGKVRAIGLANYEARHIEFCLEKSEIAPMFNQARIYPGFPFTDNLDCANKHKILTEGFLPENHTDILNSNELAIFAKKYNTSPRTICIAYLLQKECIALCQGETTQELLECYNAFNIRLSDEDMKFLDVMKNYGPLNINPDTCDF